jgi:hypothetical protein
LDSQTILLILRLLGPVIPEAVKFIASLFGGGDDETAEAIAEILAMKSPEELEAEVEAGVLPEPWATRNTWLARAFGTCTTVKTICDLQFAKPSTIPDNVNIEEQKQKLNQAYGEAELAYGRGKDAIEARDEPGYQAAMVEIGLAFVPIMEVKATICPLKKKDD